MTIKPLKQQTFKDQENSALQSNLQEWAKQFEQIPLLQGRLIEDISISSASTKVYHNLGRRHRGWIVVKRTGDSRVWETSTGTTNTYVTLDTNLGGTFSIWIF